MGMGAAKKMKTTVTETLQEGSQIQAAIESGIDVYTLIDNLRRTPEERLRRHQIALNTVEKLREARPL